MGPSSVSFLVDNLKRLSRSVSYWRMSFFFLFSIGTFGFFFFLFFFFFFFFFFFWYVHEIIDQSPPPQEDNRPVGGFSLRGSLVSALEDNGVPTGKLQLLLLKSLKISGTICMLLMPLGGKPGRDFSQ